MLRPLNQGYKLLRFRAPEPLVAVSYKSVLFTVTNIVAALQNSVGQIQCGSHSYFWHDWQTRIEILVTSSAHHINSTFAGTISRILGCIDSDVRNDILLFQHFLKSTNLRTFVRSAHSIILEKVSRSSRELLAEKNAHVQFSTVTFTGRVHGQSVRFGHILQICGKNKGQHFARIWLCALQLVSITLSGFLHSPAIM